MHSKNIANRQSAFFCANVCVRVNGTLAYAQYLNGWSAVTLSPIGGRVCFCSIACTFRFASGAVVPTNNSIGPRSTRRKDQWRRSRSLLCHFVTMEWNERTSRWGLLSICHFLRPKWRTSDSTNSRYAHSKEAHIESVASRRSKVIQIEYWKWSRWELWW